MAFTFTQLANYSFTQPNANPLDPAFWTVAIGLNGWKILANRAEGTTTDDVGDNGEFYTAVAAPSGQYIETTINRIINGGDYEMVLRSSDDQANCYTLTLIDNGDGTVDTYIARYDNNVENILMDLGDVPLAANDVFRFAAIGSVLLAYKNAVLLGQTTDSIYSTGKWGIFASVGTLSDARLTNFAAGSATSDSTAYSIPDDRNYAIFPNNERLVQGTEIFDVPAHPSHTTPVDSRKAGAPVDSRVSSIIPENSRVTPS